MKRLPNIELSDIELTSLLEEPFKSGGEAFICKYQDTLLKIFYPRAASEYDSDITVQKVRPMSDIKLKKLEILYAKQLEGLVRPLATITYKGQLIGYQMTHDIYDLPYYPQVTREEVNQAILLRTHDILNNLAANDITYADVYGRNILIHHQTKQPKFCDIDNMQVGPYSVEAMGNTLSEYAYERGIDPTTDAYMHNLLTIDALCMNSGENYDYLVDAIRYGFIRPGATFTEEGLETLFSMETPTTFNGKYLVKQLNQNK